MKKPGPQPRLIVETPNHDASSLPAEFQFGLYGYFASLVGMTSARGVGPKSSPNLIGGRSWNMKSHFHRSDGFEACSQLFADIGRENVIVANAAYAGLAPRA